MALFLCVDHHDFDLPPHETEPHNAPTRRRQVSRQTAEPGDTHPRARVLTRLSEIRS